MKAIVKSQKIDTDHHYGNEIVRCINRYDQFVVASSDNGDVFMHIDVVSRNGFVFPIDCDLEVEIKITATPKQPSPVTKILK